MNNNQIIQREAIASGLFTEEEIKDMVESGKDIPFHTYAGWKMLGMVPKTGSHGWQTRLWKRRKKKDDDESTDAENGFYLTKSFLFHVSQVEKIQNS